MANIGVYTTIKFKYTENYNLRDYEEEENINLKLKEHNIYSKIIFVNGMLFVLDQIYLYYYERDVMIFNNANLNNGYQSGYLNLTLSTLISELKNDKAKAGI